MQIRCRTALDKRPTSHHYCCKVFATKKVPLRGKELGLVMRASEELYSGRVQLECVIYPGMFSTERKVVVPVGHDSHVTYAATKLLTITEEPAGEGGVKGKNMGQN